jgi:alpha-glucoside transport system substrate-binding protein
MVGRVLVVLLFVVLAGCTAAPVALSGTVRVLGSWEGEEQAVFEAVVAPFEQRTGVNVEYVSTRDLWGDLDDALAAGDPPDIAGLAGTAQMRELAARGVLRDLAPVLDPAGYRAAVAPTFIDLGTVDGRLVGVFVRSSVKGLIWYRPSVFRMGVPRTWEQLQRMATLASRGATSTWCLGLASEESSGWPGTDIIEQFLLHGSGVAAYDAWSAGHLAWTSAPVRSAFELYGQVAADGVVYGGTARALGSDFRKAGEPLFSDPPGCLFLEQGSFMPAFFVAGHHQALADFDFFPFPPLEDEAYKMAIGGGDLLGVLTDRPEADALLRYLVSDEAQSMWVAEGGSLSVKSTVTAYPDAVTRRAAELLSGADVFRFDASDSMPEAMNAAFWQAVLRYTAEPGELDDILADLETVRLAQGAG